MHGALDSFYNKEKKDAVKMGCGKTDRQKNGRTIIFGPK